MSGARIPTTTRRLSAFALTAQVLALVLAVLVQAPAPAAAPSAKKAECCCGPSCTHPCGRPKAPARPDCALLCAADETAATTPVAARLDAPSPAILVADVATPAPTLAGLRAVVAPPESPPPGLTLKRTEVLRV